MKLLILSCLLAISLAQTDSPTVDPVFNPTADPTNGPTSNPSMDPTMNPTSDPTSNPTETPNTMVEFTVDVYAWSRLGSASQESIKASLKNSVAEVYYVDDVSLITVTEPSSRRLLLVADATLDVEVGPLSMEQANIVETAVNNTAVATLNTYFVNDLNVTSEMTILPQLVAVGVPVTAQRVEESDDDDSDLNGWNIFFIVFCVFGLGFVAYFVWMKFFQDQMVTSANASAKEEEPEVSEFSEDKAKATSDMELPTTRMTVE